MVNDNHMDNNLKKIGEFVYFGSIVNNLSKHLRKGIFDYRIIR